jgi:hypothetical protein
MAVTSERSNRKMVSRRKSEHAAQCTVHSSSTAHRVSIETARDRAAQSRHCHTDSDDVAWRLENALPILTLHRINGADRYADTEVGADGPALEQARVRQMKRMQMHMSVTVAVRMAVLVTVRVIGFPSRRLRLRLRPRLWLWLCSVHASGRHCGGRRGR